MEAAAESDHVDNYASGDGSLATNGDSERAWGQVNEREEGDDIVEGGRVEDDDGTSEANKAKNWTVISKSRMRMIEIRATFHDRSWLVVKEIATIVTALSSAKWTTFSLRWDLHHHQSRPPRSAILGGLGGESVADRASRLRSLFPPRRAPDAIACLRRYPIRSSRVRVFWNCKADPRLEVLWSGNLVSEDDMKITELEDGASEEYCDSGSQEIVPLKAKRALVGAGARVLFYPTLMYNVLRNMMQAEFRWWDEIEQTHGIDHLVIPTRDYLFAPSPVDIRRAVDFIHSNASCGRTTYVHCKAGRGRSTTIVLCYLVKYRNMTATAALEYVRSKRPRVLLAPSQWQAVQDFKRQELESLEVKSTLFFSHPGDTVLITEADLEGYGSTEVEAKELKRIRKIALARPMMARVSCFFAALMASGDLPRLPPRLPEIRAC
ncbi:hypothetical protein ZIOFF_006813 [Zingiber officinale]|uniref:Dual specificity protein phosphatase DSP8 n=1 Tax=Zingiber officinale TaxID=94328 RepID=A0A8J5HP48_ZINOF|nr:hypothetical protein ZIOFF_006813 [Zingiber officinale]